MNQFNNPDSLRWCGPQVSQCSAVLKGLRSLWVRETPSGILQCQSLEDTFEGQAVPGRGAVDAGDLRPFQDATDDETDEDATKIDWLNRSAVEARGAEVSWAAYRHPKTIGRKNSDELRKEPHRPHEECRCRRLEVGPVAVDQWNGRLDYKSVVLRLYR